MLSSVATILAVDCGHLDYPDKGSVTLSGTQLGSKASYYCTEGYVLIGESERVCLASREWSGVAPTCRSKSVLTVIVA